MKPIKRGPGRPKRQPLSGEELRLKAMHGIQQSMERRAEEEEALLPLPPNTSDVIEEADAVTRKHRYTQEQMDDLREKVDFIYQRYLREQWEEEKEINKELNARLHEQALASKEASSSIPMMSKEEWNLNHGLRHDGTKKRGPAPKRKKFFWEVEPGERGSADKPSEPIDVEAMEAQLLVSFILLFFVRVTRPVPGATRLLVEATAPAPWFTAHSSMRGLVTRNTVGSCPIRAIMIIIPMRHYQPSVSALASPFIELQGLLPF